MILDRTMANPAIFFSKMSAVRLFWWTASLLIVARVVTLLISNADLGPDEAQYWYWSRDPAFGYFSKPPMIAWIIAAVTGVFGNTEWAVRLAAPFLHLGTAIFIMLTTREISDDRTAAWAGVTWLLLPGVMLSSFLMTTDAPLLLFWSAALYFYVLIALKKETQPRQLRTSWRCYRARLFIKICDGLFSCRPRRSHHHA